MNHKTHFFVLTSFLEKLRSFIILINANFGIVFPDNRSPIRLSLNIGFTGIIGAGRVGFKLSVYYTENRFKIDMYTEFKAFEASFYIMFTLSFSIQLAFFKIEFGFSFYILQKTYIAFRYEYHKIKFYDKKTSKKASCPVSFDSGREAFLERSLKMLPTQQAAPKARRR